MINRFLMLAKLEEGLTRLTCNQSLATEIVFDTLHNFWGLVVTDEEREMLQQANVSAENSLLFSFFLPGYSGGDLPDKTELAFVGLCPTWFLFDSKVFIPNYMELSRVFPIKQVGVFHDDYVVFANDCSNLVGVNSLEHHGCTDTFTCLIFAELERIIGKYFGQDKAFFYLKKLLSRGKRFGFSSISCGDDLYALYDISEEERPALYYFSHSAYERNVYVHSRPITHFWVYGKLLKLDLKYPLLLSYFEKDASCRYSKIEAGYMIYKISFYNIRF